MPDWRKEIARRLAALKLEPAREAEITGELAQHLEDRFRELVSGGMAEDEARRAALLELSEENLLARGLRGVEQEAPQEPVVLGGGRGHNFLSSLWQDIRYGLRQLRRNPGFAAVAVITLALGIGANTAIFSMINGVLLRALPYPAPQRLYTVREFVPQWGSSSDPLAGGNFLEWRATCTAFSALALMGPENLVLMRAGAPRQVRGARVSAVFFPMLGVQPQLGRLFTPAEDAYGRNHEVVLTHEFWRNEFHSDPRVVGEAVDLSGTAMTVVGVLPANFRFPKIVSAPEFFMPLGLSGGELQAGFSMHNFFAFAQLKGGVGRREALAQLDSVEARIARQASGGKLKLCAVLTPLKTAIVGPAEQALWMLAVAAGVLLLIICVNLANLMLARNIGRSHEVAVRSALGATRWRLARQFLTEGFVLTACGAALGLLFAKGGFSF